MRATTSSQPNARMPSAAARRGATNRKLRQRRSLRLRIPPLSDVIAGAGRGARHAFPYLLLALATAGVAGGGWYGWRWIHTSPRFVVADIAITGNVRVTRDQILARAAIAPTANIFSLSLAAVERAVGRDPWIASVHATRHLPGRVVIAVQERQAAAVVLIEHPYLADAEGRLFKRAAIEQGETDGLIVVSGIDRATYNADPEAIATLVRDSLVVSAQYARDRARPPLGELHVDRTGTTLYTLDGAVAVRLGAARGPALDERLARFDVVWAALSPEERAAARTIHLDSAVRPDRVTVTMGRAPTGTIN